jgi:hypothetical protein
LNRSAPINRAQNAGQLPRSGIRFSLLLSFSVKRKKGLTPKPSYKRR